MDDKFLKPYNPKEVEQRIYQQWEDSGYFNPDNLPNQSGEPFSIVLPPPNVTGTLHIGHDPLQSNERKTGPVASWY
jgi:valyl-tRNA synthetase